MDGGGSIPQPAKARPRGPEETTAGSRGSSPMHNHASPAQRPSEKLLVLHDPFHEPLELVLSSSLFSPSAVGKVAQLRQKRASNVSLHALMDELGKPEHEEAPAFGFLTVRAVRQLAGNAAASVAKGVAEVLGLASRMPVEVELVEEKAARETAALSSVVLLFKGQYIGRADMYHVKRSLVGDCIQRSKEVLYGSISAEVQAMSCDGEARDSGLVTEETRFVFRSRTAKIFIFVQLSKEMWEFASDSNIYFELATNDFLKELFERWKENHTNHSVTIIFFSRCFYSAQTSPAGLASTSKLPRSTMHVDSKGRQYRDFFKIILDNETKKDWLPVLSLLKREFRNYPEHIGWCSPEQTPHSELPEQSKMPALAVNSSASEGNMLEAINLALNEFDKHYIDRDLRHTGQNILLISAGSGFFEVAASLAAITKQRMLDNSIGCDLVCVRKPPLHVVPLFRYLDYESKKAPDARQPSSLGGEGRARSVSQASSTSSSSSLPVATKETIYKIPYWIYISFYSKDLNKHRQDQSIRHALPTELVQYMEDARQPSFVTPHHVWAACNSYLMTKFLPSSSSAQQADARSPHRGQTPRRPPSSPDMSDHALRSPSDPNALATTPTDGYSCPSPPSAPSRRASKTSPLMMMSSLAKKASAFSGDSDGSGMAYSMEEYERLANSLSQSYQEGTPMFANDLARTAAKRSAAHTRKRTAQLWPTDMAIPAQNTSSSRRWSHLFPKPLGKLTPAARNATAPNLFTSSSNWESLTAPACLPLETDFFPTERELASDFMQGAYTLSLLPGEDVYENNTEEMVQELVSQRLAQNYQLAVCGERRQKGVHCLALGQVFHKVVSDGSNVTVKRYYHKEKVYDIPGLKYDYALWPMNHNSFRKSSVEIQLSNITRFNWNYVDQMICGEATDYFDAMRGWNIHFAVIPDKSDHSSRPVEEEADEESRQELERERIAAFLKFTGSLLRSNRIFKKEHRLEVRVLSDLAGEPTRGAEKSPSGGGGESHVVTSGSELESEEDDTLQSIVKRMHALDSGLEIVDRKQMLRTHRRCFVGGEAVDWVLRNVELAEYSRGTAVKMMQAMMEEGLVTHTSKKQERFQDGKELYRFVVDQTVVDIRRVALRERRQQERKAASSDLPRVSIDSSAHRAPSSMKRSPVKEEERSGIARHESMPSLGSSRGPTALAALSSLAGSRVGKNQPPTFSTNKRKTMKIEVADPAKQTDRYQWILFQYDEEFHPWCCFHIDIKWMICTGSAVKEIVSHMQRQARQAGVTIIQVPADRDVNRHPFRSPVRIQLPEALGVDRHMLLTRIKFIPFLQDESRAVYMHRTGVAFLEVTVDGLTWTYNYTPVLQPLMADARSLLRQLEDLCSDLRVETQADRFSSSSDEEQPRDVA